MKTKERTLCYMLSAILLAAIAYSAKGLYYDGPFFWHFGQLDYQKMVLEVGIVGLVLALILWNCQELKGILVGTGALLALFSWLHMAFVPLVLTGIYIIYMMGVGKLFLKICRCTQNWMICLLTGMAVLIVIFCIFSLIGWGQIQMIQWFVLLTIVPVCVCSFDQTAIQTVYQRQNIRWHAVSQLERWAVLLMLLVFFIQIGRMNIALDFDSLWYGLRTPYILSNGQGIYENLGTIGIVYTYSKGFEILTMPLSTLPSFGFIMMFNIWLLVIVLVTAYQLIRTYTGHRDALVLTSVVALIPAITNMAITAKSDLLTFWVQLVMFFYLLSYLADPAMETLVFSSAGLLFSWILKPTAVLFSTVIFGLGVIQIMVERKWRWRFHWRMLLLAVLFLINVLVVWARTYILTGVPLTSVYSSIFTGLGFRLKYPFAASPIPNHGIELTVKQQMVGSAKRAWQFFLYPLGKDMNHVILAWGSLSIVFFLLIWLICLLYKDLCFVPEQNKERYSHTALLTVPFLALNLFSLFKLEQVDGNYFLLFYFLIILAGGIMFASLKSQFLKRNIKRMMLVLGGYNLLLISLTSWSWTTSFTPLNFKHLGYYNHMDKIQEQMTKKGNEQIWELLSENPRARVIVVGRHPEMLLLPCNTQSYEDITGVWGNVALVKTMDRFIEFMNYARTEYVYIQAGYMKEGTRVYELMRYLIEDETLTDLYFENGNVLAKVVFDESSENRTAGKQNLQLFDKHYQSRQDRGENHDGAR